MIVIKLVDFAKHWRCHVVTLFDTSIVLELSPFRSLSQMYTFSGRSKKFFLVTNVVFYGFIYDSQE